MTYDSQNQRDPSPALGRAYAMGMVVVMAFAVVTARLYTLQIRRGEEFKNQSQNNFFQFERLEHDRGEIVDRYGRVLVTNRPSANVYVTPAFFPKTSRLVTKLARSVGVSRTEARKLARVLDKEAAQRDMSTVLFVTDLTRHRAEALRRKQQEMELPLDAIPIVELNDSEGDPRYAAYLDPRVFPSPARVLRRLRTLAQLDDDKAKLLARKIRRTRGLARYRNILVRRDLPPEVEGPLTLEVELGELPGVTVRRASARDYRFGPMAAHTIGYVNEVSGKDLKGRRSSGYRPGDLIGRSGIERTFEDALRGTDGRETIVVDSKGRAQSTALANVLKQQVGVHERPQPGHRVVLTLDLELQKQAEAAFTSKAGAVVLLEVNTGALLALTSTPSFNPSRLAGYFDPGEKARLRAIRHLRPWRFRAIQDHFAPGSTFKVVTALAALESGHTHLHDTVFCPGHFTLGGIKWRCWKDKGHKEVNLYRSLAWSCDTYYYTLGSRLGMDPIVNLGKKLGFGAPTGISLGRESAGIMPSREWFRQKRRTYSLGQAVNASIGQGAVSVTPLQLAVAFAAIANNGKVYKPRIASRVETYNGRVVEEIKPELLRVLDVRSEHFAHVREGLRRVVNVPGGTAYRHRLPDLEVSGKTGTAQVRKLGADREKSRTVEWKYRDHSWFAAIAPSDNPEVAVVVFSEHGGSGSKTAAPIAMKVLDAWNKERQRSSVSSMTSGPVMVSARKKRGGP